MKWNAWLLPLVLSGSLSAVYFLPQAGQIAESAVKMELPGSSNGWTFKTIPPSEDELGTLERDTRFAKAICLKPRMNEISADGKLVPDRVDLSVVLSGHDLNNSIHRPERCMPAQGHHITSSGNLNLQLPDGRSFKVKRLESEQTIQITPDGAQSVTFNCVTYYFFVGHDQITSDHVERTLLDMKDRLIRGMDQRWAYVSASTWYGKLPWIENEVTEEDAEKKLQEFVVDFAGTQIDWRQIEG